MYGVYIRVSSVGQNVAGQKREIQHWLKGNGIDPADVRWYIDKAGGDDLSRPSFDELQAAVFHGEVGTIVLWKLDRLSRSIRDGICTLADWCDRGLRVVSVTQQLDFNGPAGRLIAADRAMESLHDLGDALKKARPEDTKELLASIVTKIELFYDHSETENGRKKSDFSHGIVYLRPDAGEARKAGRDSSIMSKTRPSIRDRFSIPRDGALDVVEVAEQASMPIWRSGRPVIEPGSGHLSIDNHNRSFGESVQSRLRRQEELHDEA